MYLNSIKSSFYKRKGLLWEPKWPQSMADLFMGKLKEHLTELPGDHSHMEEIHRVYIHKMYRDGQYLKYQTPKIPRELVVLLLKSNGFKFNEEFVYKCN